MNMKKYISIITTIVAIFAFSGCDGNHSRYIEDDYDAYAYHLVDQDGYGVADVRYTCDEGRHYDFTSGGGTFYFYDGEDCELELQINEVDSVRDRLYIEDDFGHGVRGIDYSCKNGDEGYTNRNGQFLFDNINRYDLCTLYL